MTDLHLTRLNASCRRLAAVANELRSRLPPGPAGDDLARAAVAAAVSRSVRADCSPIAADPATIALAGEVARRSRNITELRGVLATLALTAAHLGEDVRASRRDSPSTTPADTKRLLAEALREARLSPLLTVPADASA